MNCWAATLAGWAMQATRTWGGQLGCAEDSAQQLNSNKKMFFFLFSKPFYKLQINLNANQI
jgi:hypothetical protein